MAYQKLQPGRSRPYTISTFSDTVDNVALYDNPILGVTASSGTPGVITSATATTFIQDKVQPGDLVLNATVASRGQSTLVKQVISDTELILEDADAIFFPSNTFFITPPPSEPAVLNVTQSTEGGISLKITTSGGDDLTFVGLQSGSYLPVQTTRIWETVGDNLVENGSFRSGSNLIQNGSFKEIGPELITNGNFTDISEELIVNGDFTATGSELVTDNDFESGLIGTVNNSLGGAVYTWALNTVSPISGTQDGKLSITSAGTVSHYPRLGFDGGLELDKDYVFTFDYKVNSGTCEFSSINRGGGSSDVFPTVTLTGSGTYTYYFQAQGTSLITINFNGTNLFETQFDNISVKEVGQDWTLNNWSIGNNIASNDGVNTGNLNQDVGLQQDKSYLIKGTISNYNSGTLQVRLGLGANTDVGSSDGEFSLFLKSTSTDSLLRFYPKAGSLFNGSITNISVQEVGQGWEVHDSDADHFVEFPGVGARYYSLDASVSLALRQPAIPVSGYGKIFKITANCAFTSASAIRVYSGGQDVGLFTEGDNTLYFIAQSNQVITFIRDVNTPTDVLITNVSVQEVGQDWSVVNSDMEDPDPHAYYVNFPTGYAQFIAATDTPILELHQDVLDATSSKSYEVNCNIDYGQGPDVVSNGDFSATGDDVIYNGDFADTSIALGTTGSGWVVSGIAEYTTFEGNTGVKIPRETSTNYLRAKTVGGGNVVLDDTSYKLTYTVLENNGVTSFRIYASSSVTIPNTVGTHTVYFRTTTTNVVLQFVNDTNNSDITITDIICEPLGEDWTFFAVDASNTISIESGGARVISAGVDISLRQPCLELGKFYKLTCDTTITTGKLGIANTTTGSGNIDFEEGYNEKYFTAASTQLIIKRITGVDNVLIDNITVQELDSPQIRLGAGGGFLPRLGQGDNTQTITDSASANFFFLRGGGGDVDYNAKITDVTVRETGMNWVTYGSQVNFYNGYTELVIDSSNTNVGIYQEDVFQNGVKYRVDVTMKATASFDAEIVESNGASTITIIGNPKLCYNYVLFKR